MLFSRKRRKLKCTILRFWFQAKNSECVLYSASAWWRTLSSLFSIVFHRGQIYRCIEPIWSHRGQSSSVWARIPRKKTIIFISLSLYKLLSLFVRQFVCPIITRKSRTYMPQISIGELRRPMGMFIAWFWNSKLSGSTFIAKI